MTKEEFAAILDSLDSETLYIVYLLMKRLSQRE